MLKKTFTLLIILLFSLKLAIGQSDSSWWKIPGKNVVHFDVGLIGISSSYERTVFDFNWSRLSFRTGAGVLLFLDGAYYLNWVNSMQWIIGRKFFKFEVGLGLNYMRCLEWDGRYAVPLVMLGLRIESPGRGPVFRLGVGTESSLVSVGLGFRI